MKRGFADALQNARGSMRKRTSPEEAHEIGLQAEVLDAARNCAGETRRSRWMSRARSISRRIATLSPSRFHGLRIRRRKIDAGGVIESGVSIDEIETRSGRVVAVTGNGQRFEGEKFVIAGGSWSADLLKSVGVKLPLQAGKGYSLTLPSPPERPELCSIFAEAKVAITPMDGSLRFGGTMEVGCLNLSINPARVRGIVKSVNAYFPKFSESDF